MCALHEACYFPVSLQETWVTDSLIFMSPQGPIRICLQFLLAAVSSKELYKANWNCVAIRFVIFMHLYWLFLVLLTTELQTRNHILTTHSCSTLLYTLHVTHIHSKYWMCNETNVHVFRLWDEAPHGSAHATTGRPDKHRKIEAIRTLLGVLTTAPPCCLIAGLS